MDTFIQLVVNGLGKGAVYALLALGFVVVFKATEVVNFAVGSLVLFGGYLVYVLRDVIGWYGAAGSSFGTSSCSSASCTGGPASAGP